MMLTYASQIGIASGVLFVVAYGLLNLRLVKADSYFYQGINFLGALGFTYTAIKPFNPGLFITEVVWAIVALLGCLKIMNTMRKRQSAKAKN
ncbi:CBU_0592 family membrane protein [Corynebacterium caspium]|uniref:CBU_0592 family membrane protein n=1 Tax=Corynebacterium caspium TaxID=234828 RepID=UPI00039DBE3F|nr:transporter [Corynebacterium caspium]WKD59294.1 hypothetical protein CCASP_04490 [Corynebacterium caspium DSM 44850]